MSLKKWDKLFNCFIWNKRKEKGKNEGREKGTKVKEYRILKQRQDENVQDKKRWEEELGIHLNVEQQTVLQNEVS